MIFLARLIRFFHMPKTIKYAYYMLLKNKSLWVSSPILGSQIQINLNLGDFIQYWIFMDGIYEKELFSFLNDRIQDKVFFDVGANIGNFTLSLFKKAKQIHAFEASHKNSEEMLRNIRKNNIQNITVISKAVSSENETTVTLYLSPHTQGSNSLYVDEDAIVEKVKTITLDAYVKKKHMQQVDYIKIDVEGAELEVIRGAQYILKTMKPMLIVEFNSNIERFGGNKMRTLYSTIIGHGYVGYRLNGEKVTKQLLMHVTLNENLYFLPTKKN